MDVIIKSFDQLTTSELYAVMKLRAAVFVVEQNCVYQDLDGKDQKAYHIMLVKEKQLLAYARAFRPGDYFEHSAIGRVCVSQDMRGKEYGKEVMRLAIDFLCKEMNVSTIEISAQSYLLKFYTELGFQAFGEAYLEDGIPHRSMIWRKMEASA